MFKNMFVGLLLLVSIPCSAVSETDTQLFIKKENFGNPLSNSSHKSSKSYVDLDIETLLKNSNPNDSFYTSAFNNQKLKIKFLRKEYSKDGQVLHWIGQVDGLKESYVRFTIDTESIFGKRSEQAISSNISGRIELNNSALELKNQPDGRHVLLAEYPSEYQPAKSIPNDLLPRAKLVEARGRQYDLLRNLPANSYSLDSSSGLVNHFKPKAIETIGIDTFTHENDFNGLAKLLVPYLGVSNSETLAFVKKSEEENHNRYYFNQHVNGVYLYGNNIIIDVDKSSMKVTGITASVSSTSGLSSKPKVNRKQAIKKVEEFLDSQPKKPSYYNLSFVEPRLVFEKKKRKHLSGHSFQLSWIVYSYSETNQLQTAYEIDANTGQLTPLSGEMFFFNPKTCEASGIPSGPTILTQCDPPPVVFSAGGCISTPDKCNDPKFSVPHNTVKETVDMWEDLLGDNCCNVGNNGSLDIAVDVNRGQYQPPDSIAAYAYQDVPNPWVPGGRLQWAIIHHYIDNGSPHLADITAHEMGHAFWAHKNKWSWLRSNMGNHSQQRITDSLHEAMADINAIILKNYKKSGSLGTDHFAKPHIWTLDPDSKDFSIPKTYPGDFDITDDGGHRNAKIINHLFYRVVENNNGVDFQTAVTTFLNTIALLEDDGPVSYEEFKTAMENASPNSAVRNAVKDAWEDVGIGSGSGQSPGNTTPQTPSNVGGLLIQSCVENNRTTYDIFWSSSSTTSNYIVNYLDNGIWIPSFSTPATIERIFTRINTTVKVEACNANGCSNLSLDGHNVSYLCGG